MRTVELTLWIITIAAMALVIVGFILLEGARPASETAHQEAQQTSQDYGP